MAKEIELTNGMKAIVDDEDYDYLLDYNWRALKNGKTYYAIFGKRVNGKYSNTWMHRMIMDAKNREDEINHIDHNGLNNQKNNLRKTTHKKVMWQKNAADSKPTKFKGISFHKPSKKWRARIFVDGKMKYLGYYKNEIEAAKGYDNEQKKHYGEFANLNFKEGEKNNISRYDNRML